MPPAKRRLPMLTVAADEGLPSRPLWHWSGFGAASIFVAWLPLCGIAAMLASRLGAKAGEDDTALARAAAGAIALYAAAIVLGAFAGGAIVGRWAPPPTGVRAATLGGAGAAAIAALISWASFGISMAPWLAAAVAVPAAALGGQFGARRATSGPGLPPL